MYSRYETSGLVEETDILEQETRRHYYFSTLDPRLIPLATEANDKIFQNPAGVLGIEVTVPELAKQCTLGNIDPQHSENKDQAAIEMALTADLPPTEATLVTVRVDIDSVGTMAVLALRGDNASPDENGRLQFRARQIAERDRFVRRGWPGKRPFPTSENPWPDSEMAPLVGITAGVSDFNIPIERRVGLMRTWLETGKEPEEYKKSAEAKRMDMVRALESGEIQVLTTEDGRVAQVNSKQRTAMSVGYSQAPIVVAENSEFPGKDGGKHKKFTVAQFESGYVDMKTVLEELSKCEEGWGGSANVIESPQDTSSQLSIEEVTSIVLDHALK